MKPMCKRHATLLEQAIHEKRLSPDEIDKVQAWLNEPKPELDRRRDTGPRQIQTGRLRAFWRRIWRALFVEAPSWK